MAKVIVIGAGMGGLSTGMLLARDGHNVTVLERDPAAPPDGSEPALLPGPDRAELLSTITA